MILDKIVAATRLRVENCKKVTSFEEMEALSEKSAAPFIFEKALLTDDIAFICEVKKASPSKGIIAADFPYAKIAQEYQAAGADAVSVLTEPDFFLGGNEYLREIKQKVKIPVLRKDFIIDKYQIYESRIIGADAILLICSILAAKTIKEYIRTADSLGMSCLVEAHDESEVRAAVSAGARIVGVNNRDLRTFKVDLNNSIKLRKLVPKDIIFVSESGLKTASDVKRMRENGVNALLIGEALMQSADKKTEFAKLRG